MHYSNVLAGIETKRDFAVVVRVVPLFIRTSNNGEQVGAH